MSTPTQRGAIGFRLAHELDGLLTGIAADGEINAQEAARVRAWLHANASFTDIHPFSELADHLERALADGVLSPDECQDILFVTRRYTTVNPYFDALRAGIQSLMGILAGIAADGAVNDLEVTALNDWLAEWDHLRGLWPYDECCSIAAAIVSTRSLRPGADHLHAICAQFPVAGASEPGIPLTLKGICAVDPEVVFADMVYVFTGESTKAPRALLAQYVQTLGGIEEPSVTKRSDYLIVCDGGSDHWAFSCFGRKVEKAYDLRRSGHRISIVHERDFWDALVGHGVRVQGSTG